MVQEQCFIWKSLAGDMLLSQKLYRHSDVPLGTVNIAVHMRRRIIWQCNRKKYWYLVLDRDVQAPEQRPYSKGDAARWLTRLSASWSDKKGGFVPDRQCTTALSYYDNSKVLHWEGPKERLNAEHHCKEENLISREASGFESTIIAVFHQRTPYGIIRGWRVALSTTLVIPSH